MDMTGVVILMAIFGIAIVIITRPKPKAPPKARYIVIDTESNKEA